MTKYITVCSMLLLHSLIYAKLAIDIKLPKTTLMQWKPVYHIGHGRDQILEFVPMTESLKTWSRMLTLEYHAFNYVRQDSADIRLYMQRRLDNIRKMCPNLSVNLVEQSTDTVVYWWSVAGCQAQYESESMATLFSDQHELVKLVRGPRGYNMLRYTHKGQELSRAEMSDMWRVAKSSKTSSSTV